MKKIMIALTLILASALGWAQSSSGSRPASAKAEQNIAKEVRHEILMLPYYGVFDSIGYSVNGYDVTLTPRSGDFGRDVIAVKKGRLCVRILDQVKAYRHGRLVSANDIRALIGVLASDLNASKGVVTTTSDFAPRVAEDLFIKPHIPYRLELVNGGELVKRLTDVSQK